MDSKYCKKCGLVLLEVKREDGYNISTGEKDFDVRLQCPKYMSFWGIGHTNISRDWEEFRRC